MGGQTRQLSEVLGSIRGAGLRRLGGERLDDLPVCLVGLPADPVAMLGRDPGEDLVDRQVLAGRLVVLLGGPAPSMPGVGRDVGATVLALVCFGEEEGLQRALLAIKGSAVRNPPGSIVPSAS
jgi:hypothetical protein